jgi:4-carboxymuconolactone decarboxylase
MTDRTTLRQQGEALRQRLFGDDDGAPTFMRTLNTEASYGEIWFRPGLDLRQRALVAVAAFTALKLEGQVQKFGQSALNMRLSRTEVIEAVIQTAPLSGFAPALNALGALSVALGE